MQFQTNGVANTKLLLFFKSSTYFMQVERKELGRLINPLTVKDTRIAYFILA